MLITKDTRGVSLLLGMGFSIAILATASMISSALISAQKNTRNIEDFNIAFFAAEAGIEEALFYNSFHKKGFECLTTCSPETQIGVSTVPNVFYNWDIEGHTDEAMSGNIAFGKSAAFNFSYDNNGASDKEATSAATHSDPSDIQVKFTYPSNFDAGELSSSTPDLATINWLATYLNASNQEISLNARHNQNDPLGTESDDCDFNGANDEGKFICRTTVRSFDSTPYTFTINNTFQGIDPLLASDPTGGDTGTNVKRIKTDFFDSSNATWRKLKFFYINEVPGFGSSDPALDKIQYTITPVGGNEITRLKSIITSQGRSRNILADLEVKIDNTEELGALDYGALLE
ncbi:hypothetical protein HON22_01215 [Candidatus Peregrinibacteria bacterium]|nr:hypothetical protein [Candidatus Peregrinibacteria bacterium]